MDELIRQAGADLNLATTISVWEMITVLVLSAALAFVLAQTYIFTHSGISYSSSFPQTLILVGFTVALIMVIIGSNIARAFALVGAMSIVRFRNPVKDARDIAFLFMTMAMGMAVGTKFYLLAVIFTAAGSFLAVLMQRAGFGQLAQRSVVLRIRMASEAQQAVEQAIGELSSSFSVISIDRLGHDDDRHDYVYDISMKHSVDYARLMNRLSGIGQDIAVTLLLGEATVDA